MQDTVQTTPATFTGKPPAVEVRTISYRLKTGGSLTVTCPDWCTDSHALDVECGLTAPEDLQHMGDAISLGFNVDGGRDHILEARMVQWPFARDEDETRPYVDLVPEASTGEGVACLSRAQLHDEVRKVRAHLRLLEGLADQLAEAQAVDHARNTRGALTPSASLTRTDLQSLPIAYLLRVFGVRVVESDEIGDKVMSVLGGEAGDMLLMLHPGTPQHVREDETRTALLAWHERHIGGAA